MKLLLLCFVICAPGLLLLSCPTSCNIASMHCIVLLLLHHTAKAVFQFAHTIKLHQTGSMCCYSVSSQQQQTALPLQLCLTEPYWVMPAKIGLFVMLLSVLQFQAFFCSLHFQQVAQQHATTDANCMSLCMPHVSGLAECRPVHYTQCTVRTALSFGPAYCMHFDHPPSSLRLSCCTDVWSSILHAF